MWPARYISAKNILFLSYRKKSFGGKNLQLGFDLSNYASLVLIYSLCCQYFGLKMYFCIIIISLYKTAAREDFFLYSAAREQILVKQIARYLYKAADPWFRF